MNLEDIGIDVSHLDEKSRAHIQHWYRTADEYVEEFAIFMVNGFMGPKGLNALQSTILLSLVLHEMTLAMKKRHNDN